MTARDILLSKLTLAGVPTVTALALIGALLWQECPSGGGAPTVNVASDSTGGQIITMKNIPVGETDFLIVQMFDCDGLYVGEESDTAFVYQGATRMFFWSSGDSIRHWWPFMEGTGTDALDIVSRRNAHLYGAAGYGSGRKHFCLSLPGGVYDMALVDVSLDVDAPTLQVSAWIYPTAGGASDGRIASKAIGTAEADHWWMLSLYEGTRLRGRVRTDSGGTKTVYTVQGAITMNEWQHVSMVYTGSEIRLYVDGFFLASTPHSGPLSTHPAVPVAIGNQPQGGRPFAGRIEDVKIGTAKTPQRTW